MAYYFTSDGRVVGFEAKVNSEGKVRPANYHAFTRDDVGGDNSFHSAEPAVSRKKLNNNNLTCDYNSYLNKRNEKKKKQKNKAKKQRREHNKEIALQFRMELNQYLKSIKLKDEIKLALSDLFLSLDLVNPLSQKAALIHCNLEIQERHLFISTISYVNNLLVKFKPDLKKRLSNLGKRKSNNKKKLSVPLVLDNGSFREKNRANTHSGHELNKNHTLKTPANRVRNHNYKPKL